MFSLFVSIQTLLFCAWRFSIANILKYFQFYYFQFLLIIFLPLASPNISHISENSNRLDAQSLHTPLLRSLSKNYNSRNYNTKLYI